MKTKLSAAIVMAVLIITGSCSSMKTKKDPPLQVVPKVDLKKYLGTWHEIARYPTRFQPADCVETTATYSLRKDGDIKVVNSCVKGYGKGEAKTATGKAWVVDQTTNAKLKVRFFWPFSGAYWVIDLGENYEYAVVGHPDRTYLWILSRTKVMDAALYQAILKRLEAQHYDLTPLLKTGKTQ